MEIQPHPSILLQPSWIQTIRNEAPAAEHARQLMPVQLELIYQQNWFKVLTPKQYGGLELELNQEVRLIEALAWADGSLGWVVTLCTGAGWFGGFLEPDVARQAFAQRDVCLAGSGAPTGTATQIDRGYLVSGTWKYASGAFNTTNFTANCRIIKNGKAALDEQGEPLILPFIFEKSEVNIIPAWAYNGMVATGSHSFEVNNVEVPVNRIFRIDPQFARVNGPLYQYPFHQLAEATLAVNLSGMAIHFIDLCNDLFPQKQKLKALNTQQTTELNDALEWAINLMNDARGEFYGTLDRSWANFADADDTAKQQNLEELSATSRDMAKKSRRIVDELYTYCGLEAARTHTELNRVWRDIHTASQHSLLTFSI